MGFPLEVNKLTVGKDSLALLDNSLWARVRFGRSIHGAY